MVDHFSSQALKVRSVPALCGSRDPETKTACETFKITDPMP